MPLRLETILLLQQKVAAKERGVQLDEEAQGARWVTKMAQLEIEEADKLRINALRREMEDINTQIKADGQSQEGLQLFIEENPVKTKYETKGRTFTGLPIAQTSSRAIVLTPQGLKTFGVDHRINWPDRGQIPIFAAEDMTLEDYDLKYLLPQAEFPSADVLSLKITKLLGY